MEVEILKQKVLTANCGMVLTNGETFRKTVVLSVDEDGSVWNEITESEAKEIISKMEVETDV